MPYVTGDFSDDISPMDRKLKYFSKGMHSITRGLVMDYEASFSELMEQTKRLVQETRGMS